MWCWVGAWAGWVTALSHGVALLLLLAPTRQGTGIHTEAAQLRLDETVLLTLLLLLFLTRQLLEALRAKRGPGTSCATGEQAAAYALA